MAFCKVPLAESARELMAEKRIIESVSARRDDANYLQINGNWDKHLLRIREAGQAWTRKPQGLPAIVSRFRWMGKSLKAPQTMIHPMSP